MRVFFYNQVFPEPPARDSVPHSTVQNAKSLSNMPLFPTLLRVKRATSLPCPRRRRRRSTRATYSPYVQARAYRRSPELPHRPLAFHTGSGRQGPDNIILTEDSHQRIYGARIILRNYGIETRGGATKRLYANYRTTAHNLSYATSILEGTHWIDSESEEDNVVGYRSLANGPAPVVIHAADQHEEMKANCNNGQAMAGQRLPPPMHIGILTHTNRQTSELQAFLGEREISVSSDRSGAATLLTTGCSVV